MTCDNQKGNVSQIGRWIVQAAWSKGGMAEMP